MSQYPTEEMIEAGRHYLHSIGGDAHPIDLSKLYLDMRAKEQSHSPTGRLDEATVRRAFKHFQYHAEAPFSASAMREAIELAIATLSPTEATGLRETLEGIERIAEKHTGISGARSLQTAMHAIAHAARAAIATLSPNGVSQSAVERALTQAVSILGQSGRRLKLSGFHDYAEDAFEAEAEARAALATQPASDKELQAKWLQEQEQRPCNQEYLHKRRDNMSRDPANWQRPLRARVSIEGGEK